MLENSLYLLCYILYYVCYKLSAHLHCFSAYFLRILFPFLLMQVVYLSPQLIAYPVQVTKYQNLSSSQTFETI